MGCWGADTFENDTACDWAWRLEEVDDLSLVEEAFQTIEDCPEDFIDEPFGCEALAACEVLARLKGQFGARDSYTESVDDWVRKHPQTPSRELISRADKVIDMVLGEQSELRMLWSESGEENEWVAAVEALRKRLLA